MPRLVNLNFEGVESGGGSVLVPEGDYGFKIAKATNKKAKTSGNPMIVFDLKATKGPAKGVGKTIQHRCMLTKQSLWNLRNVLEAAGYTVPAKALKLDLDKLVNKELAGTVITEEGEYKDDAGKLKKTKKSIVTAFFPMSELGSGSEKSEESEETEETEGGEESTGEESEETDGEEEEDELFG